MTICRKCGAEFKPSPTGYTVNCPDCRATRRTPAAKTEYYAVKIAEAKRAGYAARTAGDTAAYETAVANMRHWQKASGQ